MISWLPGSPAPLTGIWILRCLNHTKAGNLKVIEAHSPATEEDLIKSRILYLRFMINEANQLRKPAVAGQFYPSGAKDLNAMISSFVDKTAQKIDCFGCILPHAGYIYSGKVAACTISGVKIKDTVVLWAESYGPGATFSIMPQGIWQTPLGDVEIDSLLAGLFLGKSSI